MNDRFSSEKMLVLRKSTRAVSDLVRTQLKEHSATLSHLFRPKSVLGDFVDGAKEQVKGAEAAFQELKTAYPAVATNRPFNLPRELTPPLVVLSGVPEITPFEYVHQAKTASDHKAVTVTAPLKWILSYSGFAPSRLKELQAGKVIGNEMQEFVLHNLMLHLTLNRQPGLLKILSALRFTITPGRLPECGELPIMFLTSIVPTVRPPDEVIIQNTEISGRDAFEEVVDLEQLAVLRDPFMERLEELVKQPRPGIEPGTSR